MKIAKTSEQFVHIQSNKLKLSIMVSINKIIFRVPKVLVMRHEIYILISFSPNFHSQLKVTLRKIAQKGTIDCNVTLYYYTEGDHMTQFCNVAMIIILIDPYFLTNHIHDPCYIIPGP